mgnify:CR=1 FL=1
MKKVFERNHFGLAVKEKDVFGVELTEEKNLVFSFNGIESKQIKVEYDPDFAWNAKKTKIKSAYDPEKLFENITDSLFECYLYKYCKFYAIGVLE